MCIEGLCHLGMDSVHDAFSEKIWHNECKGSREDLIYWKQGENFASLGIGHFIWYAKDKKERFHETFPDLLLFLETQGVLLPPWLSTVRECPWDSREKFYAEINSSQMQSLRQFLWDTKHWQGLFIIHCFKHRFCEMIEMYPQIKDSFEILIQEPGGLYALTDYIHFKGDGMDVSEIYQRQGWGLLQVFLEMKEGSLANFVQAAKNVLSQRVRNSPPERNEVQFLQGWFNRLDTYVAED